VFFMTILLCMMDFQLSQNKKRPELPTQLRAN